jgi:DnaJ-class molecular chaperone
MLSTCPACQGAGQVIDDPCSDCRGQGLAKAKQELEIDIPAGQSKRKHWRCELFEAAVIV